MITAMVRVRGSAVLLLVAVFASLTPMACTRKHNIATAGCYRAMKRLEGALAVGVAKPRYDELLQSVSAELLMLADVARTHADSTVLVRYAAALEIYKDAGTLWDEKISSGPYDWIPKGHIFLEAPGRAIANEYDLTTTNRKTAVGSAFETVSESSLQILWDRAGKEASRADSIVAAALRRW